MSLGEKVLSTLKRTEEDTFTKAEIISAIMESSKLSNNPLIKKHPNLASVLAHLEFYFGSVIGFHIGDKNSPGNLSTMGYIRNLLVFTKVGEDRYVPKLVLYYAI